MKFTLFLLLIATATLVFSQESFCSPNDEILASTWCKEHNSMVAPNFFSDEKFNFLHGNDELKLDDVCSNDSCSFFKTIRTVQFTKTWVIYVLLGKILLVNFNDHTDKENYYITGIDPKKAFIEVSEDFISSNVKILALHYNERRIQFYNVTNDGIVTTTSCSTYDHGKDIGPNMQFFKYKYDMYLMFQDISSDIHFLKIECGTTLKTFVYALTGFEQDGKSKFSIHNQYHFENNDIIHSEDTTFRPLILLFTNKIVKVFQFIPMNTTIDYNDQSSTVYQSLSGTISYALLFGEILRNMKTCPFDCTENPTNIAQNMFFAVTDSRQLFIYYLPDFGKNFTSFVNATNPANVEKLKIEFKFQYALSSKTIFMRERTQFHPTTAKEPVSIQKYFCYGLQNYKDIHDCLHQLYINPGDACLKGYVQTEIYQKKISKFAFISNIFILDENNNIVIFGAKSKFCGSSALGSIEVIKLNEIKLISKVTDIYVTRNSQHIILALEREKSHLKSLVDYNRVCKEKNSTTNQLYVQEILKNYTDCEQVKSFDFNQFTQFISMCFPGQSCPSTELNIVETADPKKYLNRSYYQKVCPKGSYCLFGVKQPCPPGFYCPDEGMTQPLPCEEGSCFKFSLENPEPCPKNSMCVTPYAPPIPSPAGYFLENNKFKECVNNTVSQNWCPLGAGNIGCLEGMACISPDQIVPEKCECNATECYYCPKGTFIKKLCPPGHYCPNTKVSVPCNFPPLSIISCPEGLNNELPIFSGMLILSFVVFAAGIVYLIYFVINRLLRKNHSGKPSDFAIPTRKTNCTMDIRFENLSLQVKTNKKYVLNKVNGTLKSGRVTAVMGPSGCGKSSFLTALSGRAYYGTLKGNIFINEKKDSLLNYDKLIGFVPQEDIMIRTMTVKEILMFSAQYRLKTFISKTELNNNVNHIINVLGLHEIRNEIIGDELTRGISGGQRKRVNIGMEMVANPVVLFLDEPTSGLDSTSSMDVCKALSTIAKSGVTVATVIHQPRYEIFSSFDDVLLLGKGGRVVYLGEVDKALEYFENLGFECPKHTNPADFMMDVISGNIPCNKNPKFTKEDLFDYWIAHSGQKSEVATTFEPPITTPKKESKKRLRLSIYHLWLCFWRSIIQQFKNARGFLLDNILIFVSGLFLGLHFYREQFIPSLNDLGSCPKYEDSVLKCSLPIKDTIFAQATLTSLTVGLTCTMAALKVFGNERSVFIREYESGMSTVGYFIGKNLAQIPNILIVPLVYYCVFAPFYSPKGSFAEYYLALFLIAFNGYGFGYLISVIVPLSVSQIAAVVVSMIFFLFSGSRPFLTEFRQTYVEYNARYRFLTPLTAWAFIVPYLSYFRWSQELLYLIESKATYYELLGISFLNTMKLHYMYNQDNYWPIVGILIGFGLLFRLFAYIVLVATAPGSYLNIIITFLTSIPKMIFEIFKFGYNFILAKLFPIEHTLETNEIDLKTNNVEVTGDDTQNNLDIVVIDSNEDVPDVELELKDIDEAQTETKEGINVTGETDLDFENDQKLDEFQNDQNITSDQDNLQ